MKTFLFNKLLRFFVLMLLVLSATACPNDEACKDGIKGTIHDYTGLSGCSWIIELETGEKLEPVNMHMLDFEPADNLDIYFKYKTAERQVSNCMVGKMVEITYISQRN